MSETARRGEAWIEALQAFFNTPPEKSSLLLRLCYFEGNSCGDVAKKLGTRLNAVYKLSSRLHQGLKECIELWLESIIGFRCGRFKK